MPILLALALALASPAGPDPQDETRPQQRVSCTVNAYALDDEGQRRPARRVSATHNPAVVFRGTLAPREEAETTPLVFDVYNPRGQRYQVLLATPRVVVKQRDGRRFERQSRFREAALAVAGSSIAWTSMWGRWRVEPRLEGASEPCGKPEFFTIRP